MIAYLIPSYSAYKTCSLSELILDKGEMIISPDIPIILFSAKIVKLNEMQIRRNIFFD